MSYTVAIDPGVSWAIAVLKGRNLVCTWSAKTTRLSRVALELGLLRDEPYVIGLEDVHAGKGWGARQTFGLGRSRGFWEGFLSALGLEWQAIPVKSWQEWATKKPRRPSVKGLTRRQKTATRTGHRKALKAESVRAALEAYPHAVINTHDVADAINMARFLRWTTTRT